MSTKPKFSRAILASAFALAGLNGIQLLQITPSQSTVSAAPANASANADLAKAIRTGDLDAAKAAVADGADINALDDKKMPPIGAAALLGKVDIVNYLADQGADVNHNDGFGYTPLMCAAQRGQAGAVRALLKHHADPALKGANGNDALFYTRPNGPADPLYDGKMAAMKLIKEALAAAPAAPQPAPETTNSPATPPKSDGLPNAPFIEKTGTFDDLHFKIPDSNVWKSAIVDNNLVFSAALPPPDFCSITLFASRDLPGDAAAFDQAFKTAVDAELKKVGMVKIEKQGDLQKGTAPDGSNVCMQQFVCETKDFHTYNTFVAIHSSDRFQFVTFQTSGKETYDQHKPQFQTLLESLTVLVSKKLDAAPTPPHKGVGGLLNSAK